MNMKQNQLSSNETKNQHDVFLENKQIIVRLYRKIKGIRSHAKAQQKIIQELALKQEKQATFELLKYLQKLEHYQIEELRFSKSLDELFSFKEVHEALLSQSMVFQSKEELLENKEQKKSHLIKN